MEFAVLKSVGFSDYRVRRFIRIEWLCMESLSAQLQTFKNKSRLRCREKETLRWLSARCVAMIIICRSRL